MPPAPAFPTSYVQSPANDSTAGSMRPGALRPGGETQLDGRVREVQRGSPAAATMPALVRLLQFLMDADTADTVLHRATVSLGLLAEILWVELDGDQVGELHASVTAPDGTPRRIDVGLADPANALGRAAVQGTLVLVEQVYLRAAEIERLQAEATTDPLTGLWNRRGFEPLLDQALARAARTGEAIAVVLVDVDHFKRINDNFGHGEGDAALAAVAAALRGGIRPTDVAARIGGDEFAILLSGADAHGAVLVCERIRRALGRANALAIHSVTLSFGVADLASIGPNVGPPARVAWLAAADAALYQAKAAGRDGVACHTSELQLDEDLTRPICVGAS